MKVSSDKLSWEDLASAAQAGEKRSYEQLLREIYPYILKNLYPKLANSDWADDIAQEVLLSIHKSFHTYSTERPFKPWLHAIIHYRKADYLRRHYGARKDKTVDIDTQINLASDVTGPEALSELKNVDAELQKLPEKQREVFQMIKIQGYSAQEVAYKTGMSISAVKVSAHRTMERLKENMGS